MKVPVGLLASLALLAAPAPAQDVVKGWEFNTAGNAEGWFPTHALAPFTVAGGVLKLKVTGGDPYLHASPGDAFDIEGNDFQFIEVRMRCWAGESAEFFWANTVEGRDQGFVAGRERGFHCTPDGEWHTYVVYPLWEGKVTRLRLDPPEGEDAAVEVDYIRIVQGQRGRHDPKNPAWDFAGDNGAWIAVSGGTHLTATAAGAETTLTAKSLVLTGPVLDLETAGYKVACLALQTTARLSGSLCWSDSTDGNFPGCNAVPFEAPAGAFATPLRLTQSPMWSGALKRLGLRIEAEPGTKVTLKSLVLAEKPVGPARLRVASFGSQDAFAILGQPGQLIAQIENAGGEGLTGVPLTVRSTAAATAVRDAVRSTGGIGPGETRELTWEFTPTAEGRAAFSLESPDGQTVETEVIVSQPFPLPRATQAPAAEVGPNAAWIGNDRVLLTLVKAKAGFAHGRLDAVAAGKPRPMAVLPHLAGLCLAESADIIDLPFQEATAQPAAGQATLRLAGTTTVGGARVTVGLTLTLEQGKSYIDAAYELSADKALQIAAFRGPWLWAGAGAFGDQQDLALFPGSEYMEAGERSSSTLDIAPPMNVRFAPHPNTVTVPSMAIEKDGAIVGVMWDPLQKWDGTHDRPTAVFASPNFVEGHANHLLGLCLPSIPDYLEPNTLLAKKPYALEAGAKLTLSAVVYAEANSEVLRSMDLYFDRYGIPELPPKPRSYEDTVAMSLKSYETVLWDEAAKGWHGVLQWAAAPSPGVALEYYLLASRLLPDKAVATKLAEKGARLIDPSDLGTALHHTGAAAAALERALAAARAGAAAAPADGKYAFRPTAQTRSLGAEGSTASGICAREVRGLLTDALRSGDPKALEAALRTLRFMESLKIPRASQVWECPVHTPDILASGDCCEVYLMAYKLTGDPKLLARAVYWARTGLPFVYMWQAPEQKPFMKGGSIAIFGGSFYVGSWFARPVQWNGLAYAGALLELGKYDHSLPWKHIAEMITISGMNQQSTREKDYGTYTDNWDVIKDVECVGCMLAPSQILSNVLDILGAPHGVDTAVVPAKGRPLVINSGPPVEGAALRDGVLEFALRYYPGETAFTSIMPIAAPTRVEVDGAELATRTVLGESAEGWAYAPEIGCVVLKLHYGKDARRVRIAKVDPIAPLPLTTHWEFGQENGTAGWRALNGVAPLTVKDGCLQVQATGADPYICGPAVAVVAAEHPGVVFRAKATKPGGELFFATRSGGLAPERSHTFDLPADGQFHEVTLDLSDHPEWRGTITLLRLDFASAPCGTQVDWVRFLDAPGKEGQKPDGR